MDRWNNCPKSVGECPKRARDCPKLGVQLSKKTGRRHPAGPRRRRVRRRATTRSSTSTRSSTARCARRARRTRPALHGSPQRSTTPNLAYVTPNLCDDEHDVPCVDGRPGGLVSVGPRGCRRGSRRCTTSPAFRRDGMLVVTFDEAELQGSNADSSSCCGEGPGPNTPLPAITGPRRRPRRRTGRLPWTAARAGQRHRVQPLRTPAQHRGPLRSRSPRLRRQPERHRLRP